MKEIEVKIDWDAIENKGIACKSAWKEYDYCAISCYKRYIGYSTNRFLNGLDKNDILTNEVNDSIFYIDTVLSDSNKPTIYLSIPFDYLSPKNLLDCYIKC